MPRNSAFLSGSPPRVIAHRGLAMGAPENTLLAFAKALVAGAQIIETDVWLSSDGVAIISHDGDLKRLNGSNTLISDLSVDELNRVDLGDGQGFCTLASALDAFPETRFNIDLKTDSVVEATCRVIDDHSASDRVLITSFSESRRQKALKLLPEVATSFSLESTAKLLFFLKIRRYGAVRAMLRTVDAVQIPRRWSLIRVLSPKLIEIAHESGVEVHVWTVNDPIEMRELFKMGVDAVVTDRADLAVEVIKSISDL